jgi:hypothetical protein
MKIELMDYKNLGTVWLWLGIVVLMLNFVFVGATGWAFAYGLVYGLGFLAVGIMLSSDKGMLIGGVCAGLIGLSAVLMSSGTEFLSPWSTAILSVILFAVVVASEMGYLEWGGKSEYAKYATLVAFAAWMLWPLNYFYLRVTNAMPLPMETLLYHGGIMLLAGLDFITFLGLIKFKQYHMLRMLFAVAAILGAVLLTMVLGWGLALAPQ